MIVFPPSQRIYVHDDASDMRLGYDGLANLVVNALGCDPRSGDLFVFVNRKRNRLKILAWDHGGFWLLSKRLEEGRFPRVRRDAQRPDVCRTDLMMMLDGIEILRAKNSRRYTIAHKAS